MTWRTELVLPGSPYFEAAITLWGQNRSTLGLFPRGAFEDCVAQGRLAVALDGANTVVGYLTFRIQRRLNSAAIIHLCVRTENRGAGVADALADWLKAYARDMQLSALRLKCRRDYHAESLWQRLGFVARGDVVGKSHTGDELTVWVHSLGPTEDLFSWAGQSEDTAKLSVVVDANVFFDLHGDDATTENESKVLLEPWVDDAVKIHVVDELHNEINRHLIAEQRDAYHRAAGSFPEVQYDGTKASSYEKVIDEILGKPAETDSEKSDRRQLARSAAADADIFLTRDGELIRAATDIEARLGILVMRPTDLSGRLDETERASAYQPVRLVATTHTHCAVRASEIDEVVDRMQLSGLGEKPSALAATIRQHLAKVRAAPESSLELVREPSGIMAALLVRVRPGPGEDGVVSILRIPHTALERTLVRHLLLHAIQSNANEGRPRLVVEDGYITNLVAEALIDLGFARMDRKWVRLTPSFSGKRAEFGAALSTAGIDPAPIMSMPAGEIEAKLWPAKIFGENVACYVVPIAPTWAAQLFDSGIAAGELFGAFARLALNRENVYYRSAKNGSFTLPARILWYVKKDDDVPGTMAIRASSRLLAVETGPAKALFGRNRRIGVYEWREILATASGNPFGDIMALRFADTEQFTTPVEVPVLRSIGINSTFQSPTQISEDQFAHIYRLGTQKTPS